MEPIEWTFADNKQLVGFGKYFGLIGLSWVNYPLNFPKSELFIKIVMRDCVESNNPANRRISVNIEMDGQSIDRNVLRHHSRAELELSGHPVSPGRSQF